MVFFSMIVVGLFPSRIDYASKVALSWLPIFKNHDYIEIVTGAVDNNFPKQYRLSSSNPVVIRLLPDNLVKLKVSSIAHSDYSDHNGVTIDLRPWFGDLSSKSSVESKQEQEHLNNKTYSNYHNKYKTGPGTFLADSYQSFSMVKSSHSIDKVSKFNFQLSFNIDQSVAVFIPQISNAKPVAYIDIHQIKLPQVGLVANNIIDDKVFWKDSDPLSLKISSVSHFPLIKLEIKLQSPNDTYFQLVTNIIAKDIHSVLKTHVLEFREYIHSDITHFHLSALATSQGSGGKKYVGESEKIEITVSSSFGRYQVFIEDLKKLRNHLNQYHPQLETTNNQNTNFKLIDKLNQMIEQSYSIEFFDQYDRRFFQKLQSDIVHQDSILDANKKDQLVSDIDDFLSSHEFLSERERDQDFFPAMQQFSSLLRSVEPNTKQLADSGDKIGKYLQDRHQSWQQTLNNLDKKYHPKITDKVINQHYFFRKWQHSLDDLSQSFAEDQTNKISEYDRNKALIDIDQIVDDYRQWIDQLYSNQLQYFQDEIKEIAKDYRQNQQKLSALQKNQDLIAKRLDDPNNIQDNWSDIDANQDHNISMTEQLLEDLSQQASSSKLTGQLLNEAKQAMNSVVMSGANNNFSEAESFADLASRKLRKGAQNNAQAAHSHRQKQSLFSPDRRLNAQDSGYFGNSLVNISLDNEHIIPKKYRQHLIDDLSSAQAKNIDQSQLINRYFRQALR